MLAVVMTIIKWSGTPDPGTAEIGLFLISMAADIGMPIILWSMWQRQRR
jgi:hypothetical protein